jgi:hypothetical protein
MSESNSDPQAERHVFLSYKRADLTSPVAEMFYKKLKVNLGAAFGPTFFDKKSIDAGELWNPAIDAALDRCTHFIALLSDDYWDSEQCQRELQGAANRFAKKGRPRLLFVLTEKMNPKALVLAGDEKSAQLGTPFPQVRNLAQVNFLGPYDNAGRLVRLKIGASERVELSDQLYDLTMAVQALN